MLTYEFVEVAPKGGLKSGRSDAFDNCKEIINEKAKDGWELVQIVPVMNEKSGVSFLVNYTIIFKVNK